MDAQPQIRQYLDKLTRDFQPDTDEQILYFLRNFGNSALYGLDVYCFHYKSGIFLAPVDDQKIISLTLIRPLPDSGNALCVSYNYASCENEDSLNIRLGTFDLTATAGNPVDLAAVRIEKVIRNRSEGDTPGKIKWFGAYRRYKKIFDVTYKEKKCQGIVRLLKNIFPRSGRRKNREEIVSSLKNLESTILWLIENPQLNRFRHLEAFNY